MAAQATALASYERNNGSIVTFGLSEDARELTRIVVRADAQTLMRRTLWAESMSDRYITALAYVDGYVECDEEAGRIIRWIVR